MLAVDVLGPWRVAGAALRDLATTRSGTLSYAGLRWLPRRLVDAAVMWTVRRRARTGVFDSSPPAGDFARALRDGM